ncbi:phytanoyl-CoA dioxygenase family protein [Streptomyces sp. RK62]|uniref:phytanoyl-CoA dioxygenase family protein n=1 Tax=Streptomyces sp. RK62 TaxID=2824893 RepID=UPI001B3768D5|nr:phytanoyl-CoA dioxygenase family protein [Streptomyces sp. RK62]MBQ0997432.1 phytanoyl-CoA dioxygenase family protein [Streptomyces sp. RK62]
MQQHPSPDLGRDAPPVRPVLDRVAPSLSPTEVDQFWRDGYFGPVDGSVPHDLLDRAAARLDTVIESRARHPLYGRFSVRDWHLVEADILTLFTDPAVVGRLVSLLGDDLVLWRTKVFRKAASEGQLGWHQEWGAFNGEEIGNDVPGLQPASAAVGGLWNLTVWIALDDVEADRGPIRFARRSHRRRFPVEMAAMSKSEFWHDPFLAIDDPQTLVQRARDCSLVLDIDTSHAFDGVDTEHLTLAEARTRILDALSREVGAVTLDFDEAQQDIVSMPMRKGQFVIFTERTMHGSSGNRSDRRRLAINGRVTRADTVVYPGRLRGEVIDGSNLNISHHTCVLLCGRDTSHGRNVFGRPNTESPLDQNAHSRS